MSLHVSSDVPLAPYTTFAVAGAAEYFCEAHSVDEVKEAHAFARERGLAITTIAGGSNIVCADRVAGLVVKISLRGMEYVDGTIAVAAGEPLMDLVTYANAHGRAGLESLAGIPGTVGGAIVGNAGAYGSEIGLHVVRVLVYTGEEIVEYTHDMCEFAYRMSVFKEDRSLVVLQATLSLKEGDPKALSARSAHIVQTREKKYPPGLKCPGSFFKNQPVAVVADDILVNLPDRAVVHGKVAVGYLIEAVGARGVCVGDACVANYHGNLLLNTGNATFDDVQKLAQIIKDQVKDMFGVELEEEIRYIA